MGTVAIYMDEHVRFRCTSVDRIGVRGYITGLQYEGGVVKFLLNRGNFIPSPAVLNRNRERLRLHGVIERLPGTNTYRVTTEGIRVAVIYTKLRERLLGPLLEADQPPATTELRPLDNRPRHRRLRDERPHPHRRLRLVTMS